MKIMIMKMNLFTLLGGGGGIIAAILFHHPITAVSADCFDGDMTFIAGQSLGHIGLECLNSTSYDATEKFCVSDGTIIESDAVITCPETSPHCVQCGERGVGAALCLNTTVVPSNCVDDGGITTSSSTTTTATVSSTSATTISEEEEESGGGCPLPGGSDSMHIGDALDPPPFGEECINATSYKAWKMTCMADGTWQRMEAKVACPETTPYCIPIFMSGRDGTICGTTTTPIGCKLNSTFNMVYAFEVGELVSIGLECFNSTHFKSRDIICGADGNFEDVYGTDVVINCGGDSVCKACPEWNGPGVALEKGLCWEMGFPKECGSGIDQWDFSSGSTFRNVVASMGTVVGGFMYLLSFLY